MLTIAAFIFAAAGWLAFAKEWRAHRQTQMDADCLDELVARRTHWTRDEIAHLTAPPTHPNTES